MLSINKTCCITGHREVSPEKQIYIQEKLEKAIRRSIDDGYTHFISGFAKGVDLTFALLVLAHKNAFEITLEAAIPHRGRLNSRDILLQTCLEACDKIHVCCENYSSGCYHKRNDYMLEKSNRVIAIYDGRQTGGTFYTLNKAKKLGRDILLIDI